MCSYASLKTLNNIVLAHDIIFETLDFDHYRNLEI